MRRNVVPAAFLAALITLGSTSFGQNRLSGLVSSVTAQRHGLTRAWHTNVELDSSRGRIGHIALHVNSTNVHIIYEVVDGAKIEKFSEFALDSFGKPIGSEEAQKRAILRLEEINAEKKEKEEKAKLEKRIIPRITLYATTTQGIVQAIDGETGMTRWSALVGNPILPTLEPAASDDYVGVVNGTTLYLLEAETGKLFWKQKLERVPGSGPALSDEFVHVPMLDGMMQSYLISEPKLSPKYYKATGRTLVQPLVTPNSVGWPSDRGHFYVMGADIGGIRYRLEAHDVIVSQPAYLNKYWFVSSIDGYVYCLHEMNGDIIWRFSSGQPISHKPIVIDKSCYIITNDGDLFSVDAQTGLEQWRIPRVQQFLSASKNRLYCISKTGRMISIDVKNGSRITIMNAHNFDLTMINTLTDRIYLGKRSGMVQCLHESQIDRAIVHAGLGGIEKKQKKAQQKEDQPEDATKGKSDDPFGGGKSSDPFGGGKSDPFGGGDSKKSSDPFGGSKKSPFD